MSEGPGGPIGSGLALVALLGFGPCTSPPCLPHLTCLPSLLLVAFPFPIPPYSLGLLPSLHFLLTLAWAGGSGSGCEVISSHPWQGVAVGQEGGAPYTVPRVQDIWPLVHGHSTEGLLVAGLPQGVCSWDVLFLSPKLGLRMWRAHLITLYPRGQPRSWVKEVLGRWPPGGQLILCPLFALLVPGAGPCGPQV